jgi:hypothetical protein
MAIERMSKFDSIVATVEKEQGRLYVKHLNNLMHMETHRGQVRAIILNSPIMIL